MQVIWIIHESTLCKTATKDYTQGLKNIVYKWSIYAMRCIFCTEELIIMAAR